MSKFVGSVINTSYIPPVLSCLIKGLNDFFLCFLIPLLSSGNFAFPLGVRLISFLNDITLETNLQSSFHKSKILFPPLFHRGLQSCFHRYEKQCRDFLLLFLYRAIVNQQEVDHFQIDF